MSTGAVVGRALRKSRVPLAGGMLFLAVFALAYSYLDPALYVLRDDGLITLSHARNLVDYGFIGVGPSGERVEGYSSPVQFFVYALVYLLGGIGFSAYAQLQTLVCTFAVGVGFTLFFAETPAFALAAAAIASIGLTQLSSFIQWHASGMENALTHVLFVFAVYVLFDAGRRRRITLWLAVVPFLASITRLEGMYHIFPLLVIFAVYWAVVERSHRGVEFLAAVLVLWAGFNGWRFLYFGDFMPNVAYAQRISIGARLSDLLHFDWAYFESHGHLSKDIFSSHGGYYLLLAVPFLVFTKWRQAHGLLFLLSLSIVLTAWFNPLLFGPTRLDVTRSTTQMAIFVFVATSCVVYSVHNHRAFLLAPLLFPAVLVVHRINFVQPGGVCCAIEKIDATRREFVRIAEQESLPRPTVANPDIGVMSWYKQFNIVDLGFLSSQVVAKVRGGPVMSEYFFEYAAPDMIESSQAWSCWHYGAIFTDPRFRRDYEPVREEIVHSRGCGDTKVPVGMWVRKSILRSSASPERMFMDALSKGLGPDRISTELSTCQSQSASDLDCTYVARTVFRFIPELRARGQMEQVIAIFADSRTKDVDLFRLTGFRDGRANEKAIVFMFRDVLRSRGFSKVGSGRGFDVFANKQFVAYVKEECGSGDVSAPFYLRVTPADPVGLDLELEDGGFEDRGFDFHDEGFFAGGMCGVIRGLPEWKIKNVTTGQWLPRLESRLWEVDLEPTSAIGEPPLRQRPSGVPGQR